MVAPAEASPGIDLSSARMLLQLSCNFSMLPADASCGDGFASLAAGASGPRVHLGSGGSVPAAAGQCDRPLASDRPSCAAQLIAAPAAAAAPVAASRGRLIDVCLSHASVTSNPFAKYSPWSSRSSVGGDGSGAPVCSPELPSGAPVSIVNHHYRSSLSVVGVGSQSSNFVAVPSPIAAPGRQSILDPTEVSYIVPELLCNICSDNISSASFGGQLLTEISILGGFRSSDGFICSSCVSCSTLAHLERLLRPLDQDLNSSIIAAEAELTPFALDDVTGDSALILVSSMNAALHALGLVLFYSLLRTYSLCIDV